jgi:hypothetical protein
MCSRRRSKKRKRKGGDEERQKEGKQLLSIEEEVLCAWYGAISHVRATIKIIIVPIFLKTTSVC